jgi:hypothetical protein|uniref:Uncharacterized protein n=1 Tax=uncultured haloarchaeon TaxID=160804 RepID=A0A0K1YAX2_9EURY|nr:hypothetical protein [uncultured haloarchaeon]
MRVGGLRAPIPTQTDAPTAPVAEFCESGNSILTVEFRLLTLRDIYRRIPVSVVLHHVTIVVRTPEPPSLLMPIPMLTTARTRLRVVVGIYRVRRNLSPRRLV